MVKNLLDYLTMENPKMDSCLLKKGSTTELKDFVGPDITREWVNFSQDTLNSDLLKILSEPVSSENLSKPEYEDDWLTPSKEIGIHYGILNHWTRQILKQALKTTAVLLQGDQKEWPFLKGEVCFDCNLGKGDFKTKCPSNESKTRRCEPDWNCYQRQVGDTQHPGKRDIMYGETKPSTKFQGAWINSVNLMERRRALVSLAQITRYLNADNLRYGFLISEKELVAVRVMRRKTGESVNIISDTQSSGDHDTQSSGAPGTQSSGAPDTQSSGVQDTQPQDIQNNQASDQHDSQDSEFFGARFDAQSAAKLTSLVDRQVAPERSTWDCVKGYQKEPGGSYTVEDKPIHVVLDWAIIPWKTHGNRKMTVNLGLWCLIMLATENPIMIGHELREELYQYLRNQRSGAGNTEDTSFRDEHPSSNSQANDIPLSQASNGSMKRQFDQIEIDSDEDGTPAAQRPRKLRNLPRKFYREENLDELDI